MTKLKKYGLIILGFVVTGLIGLVGGLAFFRRKTSVPPDPPEVPPPPNFVESLKETKEKIDEAIRSMDRDALADDINSNYD